MVSIIFDKMHPENIKVAIKIRSLSERDKQKKKEEKWKYNNNSIQCMNMRDCFTFDHIFNPASKNYDVYTSIIDPIVKMCLNGINGTIIAYGHTASGKTHTIMGTDDDPGFIFMVIPQIFERKDICPDREFVIRVGYIEIYKETIYDLLNNRDVVNVLEKNETGVRLSNKEAVVNDAATIVTLLYQGNHQRKVSTNNNQKKFSSRAHSIFRIIIESEDKVKKNLEIQISNLDIIDLGDVELAQTKKSGVRLKKEGDVNKSLLCLNAVIERLSKGTNEIEFENSTLTQIVKGSLGGTSNTAIVCNINPTAVDETIATLNFANQARTIQNRPVCNKIIINEIMNEIKDNVFSSKQSEYNEGDLENLETEINLNELIFLTTGPEPKTGLNNIGSSTECGDFRTMPSSNASFNSSCPSKDSTQTVANSPTPEDNPGFTQNADDKYSNAQPNAFSTDEVRRLRELVVNVEPLAKRRKRDKTISEPSFSPTSTSTSYDQLESRSFISESSEKLALELQPIDVDNTKQENLRLINELHLTKAAHENDKKQYEQHIKAAELAKEKAEFSLVTDKLTFKDFKDESERRTHELINEIEDLKIQLRHKTLNVNIEGNSDDKNKAIIRDLRSQLEALHRINKFNSDLLIKQRDSLWRAQNENLQLTQENNCLLKKLEATKSVTSSSTDVTAGIENKIKLLEDTMSKEINILKKNLENKHLEMSTPSTTPALSSATIPVIGAWSTPRKEPLSSPRKESWSTPQKEPWSTPRKEPLSTPRKESWSTPQKEPWSTPQMEPWSTPQKEPWSTPQKEHWSTPKSTPQMIIPSINNGVYRTRGSAPRLVASTNNGLKWTRESAPRMLPSTIDGLNRTLAASSHIRSMTIPNSFIGCVIGTGGTTLANIQYSTGAKVIVSPRDRNNDRTVTMTGTVKSVSLAVEVIKMNIEREKEIRRRHQKINNI